MLDLNTFQPVRVGSFRKPVGITKGPGETTHEYTFVSRDDEQVLKNGEYVYYELFDPAEPGLNGNTALSRRVLGRIIKRVPRSEERRVGKECRSRVCAEQCK